MAKTQSYKMTRRKARKTVFSLIFQRLKYQKARCFHFMHPIPRHRPFRILLRRLIWSCFGNEESQRHCIDGQAKDFKPRLWDRRSQNRRRKRKKDQMLYKEYFGETNGSWRPSRYQKVFMKYGQCLLLGQEVTRRRHRGLQIRQVRGESDIRITLIRVFIHNS